MQNIVQDRVNEIKKNYKYSNNQGLNFKFRESERETFSKNSLLILKSSQFKLDETRETLKELLKMEHYSMIDIADHE